MLTLVQIGDYLTQRTKVVGILFVVVIGMYGFNIEKLMNVNILSKRALATPLDIRPDSRTFTFLFFKGLWASGDAFACYLNIST